MAPLSNTQLTLVINSHWLVVVIRLDDWRTSWRGLRPFQAGTDGIVFNVPATERICSDLIGPLTQIAQWKIQQNLWRLHSLVESALKRTFMIGPLSAGRSGEADDSP